MVTTQENSNSMTDIDHALQQLRIDMNDAKRKSTFYDAFLNTTFCVPTLEKQEPDNEPNIEKGEVLPLIIECEGNDYLMLFDTEERLKGWAGTDAKWVGVPGYVIAATTMAPLHLAMNVGTDYSKQFFPDEIAWLRNVVERCNEAAAEEEAKQRAEQ